MKKNVCRAGAIILNKNKTHMILVLNRLSYLKNENKWGLPKGHLRENEMPHLGAQREVCEETGQIFKIYNSTKYIQIYDTIYFIMSIDEDNLLPLEPKDKKEIHEATWIPIENIQNLNINRGLSYIMNNIYEIKSNI